MTTQRFGEEWPRILGRIPDRELRKLPRWTENLGEWDLKSSVLAGKDEIRSNSLN